jgi:hypothetical protein
MTALYRHRDDRGVLLYVGISGSVVQRLDEHSKRSRWHHLIRHVDVEHFKTRGAARAAEAEAIETERPIYNIRGNGGVRKKRSGWAIHQPDTATADGWYADYETVIDVYEFYREELPGLSFAIVERGDPLESACRMLLWNNRTIYWGLVNAKYSKQETPN